MTWSFIKHPFKLAWDITVNWQDFKEISDWDLNVLRKYCVFFPYSDLRKVLAGFLTSDLSPFPKQDEEMLASTENDKEKSLDGDGENDSDDDDEEGGAPTVIVPFTDEDRLTMVMEGVAGADSLLAYRIAGAFYQHIEDYESNVELMHKALQHIAAERKKTSLALRTPRMCSHCILRPRMSSTRRPRNHREAKTLFDRC